MPIVTHEQTQNDIFSFESEKVEKFYAWLLNEGKDVSSKEKMKAFFTAMGIDVNQKKHDSLFIQHQVGLGLRELMKQHHSKLLASSVEKDATRLNRLEAQVTDGTKKSYEYLHDEMIVTAADLFGISVEVEIDNSKPTKVLSQEILHSGSDGSAHFNLKGHETAGNGNCALNALAQAFAVELGMDLTPASSEERADYRAGTFIPTASVSQAEKLDTNLQELKSLLSVDQTDLKAIIMEELSINAEPTDTDLKRFIEIQDKRYQAATTTPFRTVVGAQSGFKSELESTPIQAG